MDARPSTSWDGGASSAVPGLSVNRGLLIGALAFSSGVHLALVPEHLVEMRLIGLSFIQAAVIAAAAAVVLALWPASPWPPRAAALLFLGMGGAYALAVSVAVPGVAGTPEPIEWVALVTKAVELVGLGLAVSLRDVSRRARGRCYQPLSGSA